MSWINASCTSTSSRWAVKQFHECAQQGHKYFPVCAPGWEASVMFVGSRYTNKPLYSFIFTSSSLLASPFSFVHFSLHSFLSLPPVSFIRLYFPFSLSILILFYIRYPSSTSIFFHFFSELPFLFIYSTPSYNSLASWLRLSSSASPHHFPSIHHYPTPLFQLHTVCIFCFILLHSSYHI